MEKIHAGYRTYKCKLMCLPITELQFDQWRESAIYLKVPVGNVIRKWYIDRGRTLVMADVEKCIAVLEKVYGEEMNIGIDPTPWQT